MRLDTDHSKLTFTFLSIEKTAESYAAEAARIVVAGSVANFGETRFEYMKARKKPRGRKNKKREREKHHRYGRLTLERSLDSDFGKCWAATIQALVGRFASYGRCWKEIARKQSLLRLSFKSLYGKLVASTGMDGPPDLYASQNRLLLIGRLATNPVAVDLIFLGNLLNQGDGLYEVLRDTAWIPSVWARSRARMFVKKALACFGFPSSETLPLLIAHSGFKRTARVWLEDIRRIVSPAFPNFGQYLRRASCTVLVRASTWKSSVVDVAKSIRNFSVTEVFSLTDTQWAIINKHLDVVRVPAASKLVKNYTREEYYDIQVDNFKKWLKSAGFKGIWKNLGPVFQQPASEVDFLLAFRPKSAKYWRCRYK